MALSISQLVNDYGSYSGKTLIGIRGARKTVPGSGFGGIQGVPYDNITFIVKVNGTRYASSRWLSQQQNGNPYIHSTSVARIDLQDIPYAPIEDIIDIRGVPKNMTGKREPLSLKLGEQFAEVNATSKLTTDDAILSFINDLLSESPDVKPWDNYGNFEPKIYTGTPPGTPPDVPDFIENKLGEPFEVGVRTPYGGTYNPELDMKGLYPGMEFEPKKVSLFGVVGEAALAVSIPPTTEVVDVKEIPIPPIEIEPIDLGPYFTYDKFLDGFDFGVDNLNPITNNNVFGDTGINTGGLDSLMSLGGAAGLTATGNADYLTDYSGQPMAAALGQEQLDILDGFGSFG